MTLTGFGHDNLMGHRVISRLAQVKELARRPGALPKKSNLRGVKRQGLVYERRFAVALEARVAGTEWTFRKEQWFQFLDENGSGFCQPDSFIFGKEKAFVFECKLTDTEKAQSQLSRLYVPILREHLQLEVFGIVVTRHLTQTTDRRAVQDTFGKAIAYAVSGKGIPILHWRERQPL
jgi:hypothetical protein